jgi:processive 1,2-diacylglycerol beta-glucosyltransferase
LNILFITSNSTGQGHKSITEAVSAQIKRLSPDVNISILDGFAVGNIFSKASGRVYNTIAVYFPFLWELIYRFSDRHYRFINKITVWGTESGIMGVIKSSKPDIIISVHAAFVGSIMTILENHNCHIPLISIVADLDNVTALWFDKRAKAVICPTREAKRKMIIAGMPPERLYLYGFPLREQFTASCGEFSVIEGLNYESDKPLALLISGSQGSRRSSKIVKLLLRADCCKLCVVTGSNKILRKELEIRYAADLGKRLNIIGFTKELDKYMRAADFLIARASPNVMMEAVCLGKPVIATDAFPGQEKKNPEFMRNHHLGVYCKKIELLPNVVRTLTADNGARLKEISRNQQTFYRPDCTKRIAMFAIQCANKV